MLKARTEKKVQKINHIKEELIEKFESDSAEVAPLLDEADITFVAQSQVKLSQREILRMHVKNHGDLSLK